ncbi:MAG: galactose-1-phosphate uridylyltransferase, partial [bacterium]|nr:galactose-1-phosphate uridylyltransferase [bacterium]
MPELRKDPIIGRWVIIASERAKRPLDFVSEPRKASEGFCPFCPGNEDKTPEEVLAYRPADTSENTAGWWVRVVPNKFPALVREGGLDRAGDGMYDRMNGIGAHEVIIESPSHNQTLTDYSLRQVQEILWCYRDRIMELKKDPNLRYIMIFKNYGWEAGASLDHPHSQVIALPIIPKRVKEEIDGAQDYFKFRERCVFCDMVRQEMADQKRVVLENEDFLAFCPYASRFPFETWILPKKHTTHYMDIQKKEL